MYVYIYIYFITESVMQDGINLFRFYKELENYNKILGHL